MKSAQRCLLVLAVILFLGVGRASADSTLSYSFTGSVSASFELPVNPTVMLSNPGVDFAVAPMDLMVNGQSSSDFLVFFSSAFGGGFDVQSCPGCVDLALAGPQLYSGSEAAPTMLAVDGAMLVDDMTGAPVGTVTSTPTGTTATPEPSVLLLLSLGLLAFMSVALFSKRFASYLSIAN
jgi:hypothetical protein